MNKKDIIEKIKATESPLKRQLLMTALITAMLEEGGNPAPVLIGELALSYYTGKSILQRTSTWPTVIGKP